MTQPVPTIDITLKAVAVEPDYMQESNPDGPALLLSGVVKNDVQVMKDLQ
jgi:hypothetical protein